MSADLTLRNGVATITKALVSTLNVAMRKRSVVADVAALRAFPTKGLSSTSALSQSYPLAYVTAAGYVYSFDNFSTVADDGSTVIQPTDRTGAGRWLRTDSTATTIGNGGEAITCYARAVQLYQGEGTEVEALERILGVRPAVLVRWLRSDHSAISTLIGSLYQVPMDFEVWAISSNFRRDNFALVGSQIATETADPGADRILGDVKAVLAGNDLGLGNTTPGLAGVDRCEPGEEQVVVERYASGLFVTKVAIKVFASLSNAEADAGTLVDLASIWNTQQLPPATGSTPLVDIVTDQLPPP